MALLDGTMIFEENELIEIIIFAFRYALGRRTFSSETMVQFILRNWKTFSESHQKFFQKEIREAIENNRAGSKIDIEQWNKILYADDKCKCNKELFTRDLNCESNPICGRCGKEID